MRSHWSFEFGLFFGVTVRIHITLLILIGLLTLGSPFGTQNEEGSTDGWLAIALISSLILHELAHASAAALTKVHTRAITLFPFGSVASFIRAPSPTAQSVIGASGPFANLIVAALILALPYSEITSPAETLTKFMQGEFSALSPFQKMFSMNLVIAAANLLPALPLDGGRVLKGGLLLLGVKSPAVILSRTSQLTCLCTALIAFYYSQPALFVAAFVIFFGALQEHVRVEGQAAAVAFTVADAMIPESRLEGFTHGTTVTDALKTALTSLQPFFPIRMNAQLVGFVLRDGILEHSALSPNAYINTIAIPPLESIQLHAPLVDALTLFEDTGAPMLVVKDQEEFVGVLVPDRVAEFVIMKSLPNKPSDSDDVPWSIQM
jgi:Zn-dependent protease